MPAQRVLFGEKMNRRKVQLGNDQHQIMALCSACSAPQPEPQITPTEIFQNLESDLKICRSTIYLQSTTIADIAAWRGRRMKFGYFDAPAGAYAAYVKGIEELCGLSLAEICPRLIRGA